MIGSRSPAHPWRRLRPPLRRAAAVPVLAAGLLAAGSGLASGVPATATAAAGAGVAAGPCISVTGLQPAGPAAPAQTRFNGVSMRSGCDAWAVGTTTTSSGDTAVIQHFDGSGWSAANPDVAGQTALNAVTAIAADSAWAVGSAGSGSLIEHWDGTAWHTMASPAAEPAASRLNAIWAVSPTSIWAVGETRNTATNGDRTLIEHYDGSQWTVSQNVPSPAAASGLTGVTATSATDVWAVGFSGPGGPSGPGGSTLIEHWNGSAWTVTATPLQADATLTGVAATTPQNAWAAGYQDQGFGPAPVMLHWNGRNWSSYTPLPAGGGHLFAITTTSDTPDINRNIWAVGDTSAGASLAWRWDGSSWVAIPSPSLGDLSVFASVSASSATSVWLAGNSTASRALTPIAVNCC